MKVCITCKIEQPEESFHKKLDGLQPKCKSCTSIYNREYRKRPHVIARTKEYNVVYVPAYRKKNRPRMLERSRNYYETHKEECLAAIKKWEDAHPGYAAEYFKTRRETDVQFRLGLSLRSRLNVAVSGNYKAGSAIRDLGCSVGEFKTYLESLFAEGMTWENYGRGRDKWQIDHHVPMSAFDLTNRQHVVLACHYLNLRPMWALENIAKHNKLPYELAA